MTLSSCDSSAAPTAHSSLALTLNLALCLVDYQKTVVVRTILYFVTAVAAATAFVMDAVDLVVPLVLLTAIALTVLIAFVRMAGAIGMNVAVAPVSQEKLTATEIPK